MMDLDWNKLVDAAHEANDKATKFGNSGKKYSTVATRIELARRIMGPVSITTEILDMAPNVVVRAMIALDGVVLATGTAEEVRGQGYINKTSALENAETSAVGRALAFLGIHGGEIASLNELEAVGRKEQAIASKKDAPLAEAATETSGAYEDRARDELPEDASEMQVAMKMVDLMKLKMADYRSLKGLEDFAAKNSGALAFIQTHANGSHAKLRDYYRECKEAIDGAEAA